MAVLELKCLELSTIRGLPVYVVESPLAYSRDNPEIVGTVVSIDGKPCKVVGVERSMIRPDIRVGERIGLVVESV